MRAPQVANKTQNFQKVFSWKIKGFLLSTKISNETDYISELSEPTRSNKSQIIVIMEQANSNYNTMNYLN